MKCDFCEEECDGKNILRDPNISRKDGSGVVLCNDCINNYMNRDYDKIKLKDADCVNPEVEDEKWKLI